MFYEEARDQLALGYWGLPPSSSTKQRFTEHYWLNIYRSWSELCCTAGLGNYHISELEAGNWNWCKIQAIRWYIEIRRLNIYFKRILDHEVQWGDIRMIFWCIICIVRGNLHCCLVFTLLLCHGVTSRAADHWSLEVDAVALQKLSQRLEIQIVLRFRVWHLLPPVCEW